MILASKASAFLKALEKVTGERPALGGVSAGRGTKGMEGSLLVVVLAAFEVQIGEGAEGEGNGAGAAADEFCGEGVDFVLDVVVVSSDGCRDGGKMLTNSRGVSNGAGNGDWPRTFLIYDEWRASIVKIAPAAVTYSGVAMEAAAPR